jgi:hypothetical protein
MKQKQNNKDPQNKRFKTATKEKSQKLDLGARSWMGDQFF